MPGSRYATVCISGKKYALCSTRTSCEKEADLTNLVYEETATTWMTILCFTMLVLLTVTMTGSDLFVLDLYFIVEVLHQILAEDR